MPIPNANLATVAEEKVRDYLLNMNHPDGGPKAVWFHLLGYSQDRWIELADDLLQIARCCEHFDVDKTLFGVKYIATGTIGRTGNQRRPVLTVWIEEDHEAPRLVTAYPEDVK